MLNTCSALVLVLVCVVDSGRPATDSWTENRAHALSLASTHTRGHGNNANLDLQHDEIVSGARNAGPPAATVEENQKKAGNPGTLDTIAEDEDPDPLDPLDDNPVIDDASNESRSCSDCDEGDDGDDPNNKEGWLEASKVERQVEATVSNLVICFLVFNMMILILVSFPDGEVQRGSLKTLSMCIAIFCAVLFEHGHLRLVRTFASGFLPERVGENTLIYAVDFPLLMVWFFLNSYIAYTQRNKPISLHAVTMVFSHVTVFIAIGLFKHVPESLNKQLKKEEEYWNTWIIQVYIMCITAAVIIFWGGIIIAKKVSLRLTKPSVTEVVKSLSDGHESHEHAEGPLWIEHVWEEEVEASALLVAFLVRNCICSICIFSAFPQQKRFVNMALTLVILVGATCGFATVRVIFLLPRLHLAENKHWRWVGDTLMYFETICIMTVGWLIISFTRHGMTIIFGIYPHLRYVYTTLTLSPLCLTSLAIIGVLRRYRLVSDKVVRCVELALGLVVGFSWEKALKEAIHHVVHEVNEHEVGQRLGDEYTEAIICCGLGGFMMIVWGYFLVPRLVDSHGHALTDDIAREKSMLLREQSKEHDDD